MSFRVPIPGLWLSIEVLCAHKPPLYHHLQFVLLELKILPEGAHLSCFHPPSASRWYLSWENWHSSMKIFHFCHLGELRHWNLLSPLYVSLACLTVSTATSSCSHRCLWSFCFQTPCLMFHHFFASPSSPRLPFSISSLFLSRMGFFPSRELSPLPSLSSSKAQKQQEKVSQIY